MHHGIGHMVMGGGDGPVLGGRGGGQPPPPWPGSNVNHLPPGSKVNHLPVARVKVNHLTQKCS